MDSAMDMDDLDYQMSNVNLSAVEASNKDVNALINQAAENVSRFESGYF